MGQRLRSIAWRTVAVALAAALLLVGAGVGVLRFMDYSDSYEHGAADAAVISEQIQALAVVAAQAAAPDSNLSGIQVAGLDAGIKVRKTLDRLIKLGNNLNELHRLERRLSEYYASLGLVDRLFGAGNVAQARVVSAGTSALVAPITSIAHELQYDLKARADTTGQVARLGSVTLLVIAVAVIAFLTGTVERRQRREAVRAADYSARARFETVVEHSADLMVMMDRQRQITYASPALGPVLGYEVDAWVGTRQAGTIHEVDRPKVDAAFQRVVADGAPDRLDVRVRHADGTWRILEADVARLVGDDDDFAVLWTARDVTTHRDMEDQLRRQAFEDPLTLLPNRAVLHDRLTQAVARSNRSGAEVAVLLLDLDNFKEINDSLGHRVGDIALVHVAELLVAAVREGDTVARLGGDEFVVVAEGFDGRGIAEELAHRIHAVLAEAAPIDGTEIRIGASIGAVIVAGASTADDVVRDADLAMYEAKSLGSGRTVFFEGQMLHDAQDTR